MISERLGERFERVEVPRQRGSQKHSSVYRVRYTVQLGLTTRVRKISEIPPTWFTFFGLENEDTLITMIVIQVS